MEGAIKEGMADESCKVGLSPGPGFGKACTQGGGKAPVTAPVEEGAVFQRQGPGALVVVENIRPLTAKAEKAFEILVGENGLSGGNQRKDSLAMQHVQYL